MNRDHVVTLAQPLRCIDGAEYPAGQCIIARPVDQDHATIVALSGKHAGKRHMAVMDNMMVHAGLPPARAAA